MKKILFAAYSMDVGGIETALLTLLQNINKKYNITLVLEKKEGVFLKELPENVKIISYKPNNCKIKVIRKILNFVKQQIFKIKYKNKFDFSACYATYSKPSSFVARTTSRNNCLWVHNDYMNFFGNNKQEFKKFFLELRIEKFKKIVFVSKNDKEIFLKQFPEFKENCIYCNNLINYEKIEKKSKEIIQDFEERKDIETFINIGRHDEKQKKLSRIIKATRKLNEEGYIFRVVFIGTGKDFEKYKSLAKDISNIEFLGAKPNPYPYLQKSDCLILSSDFEGYPVVFIESLILQKPIITTDVSDSKSDIDGTYGIVVEKSVDGVYSGMKQFLEHGFEMAKFSPENYNKKIMKTLAEIFKL